MKCRAKSDKSGAPGEEGGIDKERAERDGNKLVNICTCYLLTKNISTCHMYLTTNLNIL